MSDERKLIPIGGGKAVYLGPAKTEHCAVHEWPTNGLARRLVRAMKDTHPKGINACRDCVARAVKDAKP